MTAFFDPVVSLLPKSDEFGYAYEYYSKMNNLNHFDFLPPASVFGPSGSGSGSGSGSMSTSSSSLPTLAPTTSMSGLSAASPTYPLGTPYSSTSESSNASSPDVQSLLPPHHSWPQPSVSPGAWYGVPPPGLDGTAPGSSTSPMAPWPLETDSTNDGRQCHSISYGNSLLHPHAARHHPYLAGSSMPVHRHALAAMAGTGSSSMGTLQPPHLSPHGASAAGRIPGLSTGDERPKSGRLGVKRRQKYTRTRTGCLGCRARRIKCDEGRPICRRCTVAKRECVFPDPNEAKKSKKGWTHSDSEEDTETVQTSGNSAGKGSGNGSAAGSSVSASASASATDVPSIKIDTSIVSAPQPASAPAALIGGSDMAYIPSGHSVSEPGSASDLTFDLSQAIPEGFGIGGEPLGWDRAFTEAFSPNNLGLDLSAAGINLSNISNISNVSNSSSDAVNEQQNNPSSSSETPLLNTPNFLLPWFPTSQEQSLILHYCANAADLMMAIPQGLNPMLAINLPLALQYPRGMNTAADALRVTLLGIGAVHQAFLLARSGVKTAHTSATFQYAANLRDMAKTMVRRAMNDTEVASDAALSAATSLATIDIFFGGSNWQDNFAIAKRLVAVRGGPAKMLKASSPTQLADGVSVTPARLLLEVLAIYESFGCLTLNEEPTLLAETDNWWFERSESNYEGKSVEMLFGMSKVMVHLFSRVSRLLARVAKLGRYLEKGKTHDGLIHIDSVATGFHPASVMPILQDETTEVSLQAEAEQLDRDIEAWMQSMQVAPLEHERVQVGNKAYAHAMKILLSRMVYGHPRSHPDVQDAAQQVLQHCSISTAALGMSIDLMWPAVVAGCEVDGDSRQWTLTLLEGFKAQCCFDVDTASRIIQEVWRRVDGKQPRADWKAVCNDLNLKVLLC